MASEWYDLPGMKTLTRRQFGKTLAGTSAAAFAAASVPGLAFAQSPAALRFPDGFLWGCATASYQVEGAVNEDGRGQTNWDVFSHTPGKTFQGDTGDVADDSYHLYKQDVQLLKDLGVKVYRMSIAWARIFPNGTGRPNDKGMAYYDRVVDELLKNGITPYITLFHWDLPQALQDEFGGWASRETATAFAEYADVVSRRLGDRVHNWITLNEPQVCVYCGHEEGIHAPGLRDSRLAWQASHSLLLAHGMAVPVLRANGGTHTNVGITLNLASVHSATTTDEDQFVANMVDGGLNRWYLDPIFCGSYPDDILNLITIADDEPR